MQCVGKIREWWTGEVREQRDTTPPPSDPSTVHNIPSRQTDDRFVSSRDALGMAAVYRAVEIRAVGAKQISIDAFRGNEQVEREPLILRRPDPFISRPQFIEQTVISLNLAGNCYWRIIRDPEGIPSSLWVMNPHDVVIDCEPTGRVTGYQYHGEKLRPEDVKHLARMRVPGTPYGLGPIQAAQAELRGSLDTMEYGSNFINSGDVPTGILKSDQMLTKETSAQAKQQYYDTRGGKRDVLVLGQGLDYRQMFVSPREAQFIESQNWNVTTITRLFGVPSSLMLVALDTRGSGQTYQNVEQDWLGFVRFGLANDLIEIEDAFTDLLPRGQRARFNIEALLRADTKSRYESYEVAVRTGWRLKNEVRKIEGLDEIPGLDDQPEAVPAPVAEEEEATA
jgi:HK97 family phage portal protein